MQRLSKFWAMPSAERFLLLKGLALLAAASIACRLFSFQDFRRFLARKRTGVNRAIPAERICSIIVAAARFVPGATCLVQAIVAESLIAQGGRKADLVIGVCRNGKKPRAHAWIESDGNVLMGGPDSGVHFERLTVLEQ